MNLYSNDINSLYELSICIPTYNRAMFLDVLLQSISVQTECKYIEVVISDNASTDSTDLVIEKFRSKFGRFVYCKSQTNVGPDRNYVKAISLASGKYCWFLGSDDYIEPSSLSAVLHEIRTGNCDLYLLERWKCDYNLFKKKHQPWFNRDIYNKEFDISNHEQLSLYLDASISLGAIFSYLSVIVIRREVWTAQPQSDFFIGTGYVHVAHIFKLFTTANFKVKALNNPLILCRGDNDSFNKKSSPASRLIIDVEGYAKIGKAYLKGDHYHKLMLIVKREWDSFAGINSLFFLMYLRAKSTESDWNKLNYLLSSNNITSLNIALVNFIPVNLLALIGKVRRMLKINK